MRCNPENLCFHDLFERQALATPDGVAMAYRGSAITYRALNTLSNQIAHQLLRRPDELSAVVAVCSYRSPEVIAYLLGIMKAGAAYLYVDPEYPDARIRYMLDDARASTVLLHQQCSHRFEAMDGARTIYLPTQDSLRTCETRNPSLNIAPTDLAYVIYTSGSTGRPKGVMVQHGGLRNLAQAQAKEFGIRVGTRVLQFSRWSFDASVSEIVMSLSCGATLCIADAPDLLPGRELAATLKREAIDVVTLPPSALVLLNPADTPELETLVVAGEACSLELARCWAARGRLINAYGPTESTVCATMWNCSALDDRVPIGTAMEGVAVYVLDDHLSAVGCGQVGEIYIGGVGVARGYLRRPALTADRFIPDPFGRTPGSRLYRTGDLGKVDEGGIIEYLGRADQQVKLRGFRVEPGEIEQLLLLEPTVRQAAVVVRENSPGNNCLVAYVVTKASAAAGTRRLVEYLREALPDYMVPSFVVRLPELPLTANGKVDKAALPAPPLPGAADTFVAPEGEVEKKIASIWADALKLQPIGLQDEFRDLGGYSLLAVRIVADINECFDVQFSVADFLAAQTVARQAQWVARAIEHGRI